MSSLKNIVHRHRNSGKTFRRIRMRCHLNADKLYARIRTDFDLVPDHRASNSSIAMTDALLSGLAHLVFGSRNT